MVRGSAAKRTNTTMTNAEATAETKTAAVAEQGAKVAPEKASLKKGANRRRARPRARKPPRRSPARRQEGCAQGSQACCKKASKPKDASVPREFSKKEVVLELLRRPKGATIGRDRQGHRLAEPLNSGLHFRPTHQEDGAGGRVHEERGGRAALPDRPNRRAADTPPPARVAAFFRSRRLFPCFGRPLE